MANLSLLGVPISAYTSTGGGGNIWKIQDGVKPFRSFGLNFTLT
jgi:hypothetical protein